MIDRIGEAAYWSYRERFLREKLGEAMAVPTGPPPGSDNEVGPEEEPIDLLKFLADEGIDSSGDDKP